MTGYQLVPASERVELIRLSAVFGQSTWKRHKKTLKRLGNMNGIDIRGEDRMELNLDFRIEYRGIVAQLEAVTALLNDAEAVITADLFERNGLDCMIVELADAVRDAQSAYSRRLLA